MTLNVNKFDSDLEKFECDKQQSEQGHKNTKTNTVHEWMEKDTQGL